MGCIVQGCSGAQIAKGYCRKHYQRLYKYGTLELCYSPRELPLIDHILSYIEIDATGCWLWTRSLHPLGYVNVSRRGKSYRASRVIYEHFNGPIPIGLEIDHLCRRRHCLNPEHLEAVTHKENVRRALPYREKYGTPEERKANAIKAAQVRWGIQKC